MGREPLGESPETTEALLTPPFFRATAATSASFASGTITSTG